MLFWWQILLASSSILFCHCIMFGVVVDWLCTFFGVYNYDAVNMK